MSVQKLVGNITVDNLSSKIKAEDLTELGNLVTEGYQRDKASRSDWEKSVEAGLKIAKQIIEPKTYPWEGAANIKYPMIAVASIQFAARAYPEIVRGNDVVKAFVIGEDLDGEKEQRAKRVSQHMSWQNLEQIVEWEKDTDTLLHGLPIMGNYFRKSYFDPSLGRIRKVLVNPMRLVVNMKSESLELTRRATHELDYYKNQVVEFERSGLWNKGVSAKMQDSDIEEQELFLEQHRWYDLDGDGYEEPYIVTVHNDSGTVCRVKARYEEEGIETDDNEKLIRINPEHYFTKYTFIPDPEGLFYDLGFAQLLGPINETMNTIINQLLDAGHLSNLQCGFIGKGVTWRGGNMRFKPGEWKPIDVPGGILKDSIVPLPVRDPSPVLFQLLGLLEEVGMKVSSVSEQMAGESPGANVPATTTLALIEQGLKVFTAIYKRIYRSLKEEFRLQYHLNSIYMNDAEYFRVLDSQNVVGKKDYASGDYDVYPAAEPTLSSEAQRLARAQALLGTMEMVPVPEGKIEILKRYYEALQVPKIEEILPPDAIKKQLEAPPPPNPEVLRLGLDTQKAKDEEHRKRAELSGTLERIRAQIEEIDSRTAKNLVEAENMSNEPRLKELQQEVEVFKASQAAISAAQQEVTADGEPGPNTARDVPAPVGGGDTGMAGGPPDAESLPIPGGGPGELPAPAPLGAGPELPVDGADSPPVLLDGGQAPDIGTDL